MARISNGEQKRRPAQSAASEHRVTASPPRILRCPEVQLATGLGRTTIYEHMAAGKFPKPIQLTEKSVGWLEPEIIAWQQARIAQRDGAP
jgi:prophage regulatory protein